MTPSDRRLVEPIRIVRIGERTEGEAPLFESSVCRNTDGRWVLAFVTPAEHIAVEMTADDARRYFKIGYWMTRRKRWWHRPLKPGDYDDIT